MSDRSAPFHAVGDVVELGERSFVFDGTAWQPSVSPAGQALIAELGQPRPPFVVPGVHHPAASAQGWPVQVVVSPPDYERQASTFILVWLKYVLLIICVVAVAGLLFLLVSGGMLAAIVGSLLGG